MGTIDVIVLLFEPPPPLVPPPTPTPTPLSSLSFIASSAANFFFEAATVDEGNVVEEDKDVVVEVGLSLLVEAEWKAPRASIRPDGNGFFRDPCGLLAEPEAALSSEASVLEKEADDADNDTDDAMVLVMVVFTSTAWTWTSETEGTTWVAMGADIPVVVAPAVEESSCCTVFLAVALSDIPPASFSSMPATSFMGQER